jgi:CheY-like chemotaxis protein
MKEFRKNTILVIDDSKENIFALTHILTPEHIVYAAKSGIVGLEIAQEQAPDIILLDIMMPDMDGYEVLAELKKGEKTRDIPVIFVTGLDSVDSEEKGLYLGAVDYISKPFSPAIVKLRVKKPIKDIGTNC